MHHEVLMTRYDLLSVLLDNGGEMEQSQLLNKFPDAQVTAEGFIQMLLDDRCIKCGKEPRSTVSITFKGKALYSQLDQEKKDHDEERAYIRAVNCSSRNIAIIAACAGVIAAVLSFIQILLLLL
jgi:hypothetical protein